jgi:lysophospholipase L1-like esterase
VTKSILCYGDSITWGYNPKDGTRFSPEDRWPRILEQALDGRARVIEEALNGLTPGRIAMNLSALIRTLRSTLPGIGFAAPAIVLMAPPLLGTLSAEMALFYAGGQATSRGLADAYRTVAQSFGCHFFDAGAVVQASAVDGVHLDPPEQRKLALAVKEIVEPLL